MLRYAKNASDAGLDGVVCSPLEAKKVKEFCGDGFLTVTPGIRFAEGGTDDQKRIMQAEEACREAERRAASAVVDGPHISLTGAHGGERLYGDVAAVFSLPVTDDTCTGRRDLALPSGEGDFFTRYAEALLRQGQPCMCSAPLTKI